MNGYCEGVSQGTHNNCKFAVLGPYNPQNSHPCITSRIKAQHLYLDPYIFVMALGRRNRIRNLILMENEEDQDAALAVLIRNRMEVNRRLRHFWVKPWLQRRCIFGQYETLFQELDRESEGDYLSYIRMDRNLFAEVLHRVEPRISKCERYALL